MKSPYTVVERPFLGSGTEYVIKGPTRAWAGANGIYSIAKTRADDLNRAVARARREILGMLHDIEDHFGHDKHSNLFRGWQVKEEIVRLTRELSKRGRTK